jgi:DNA-binding transcriptional LysR family regulator
MKDAAIAGVGVAIVRQAYVEAELANGLLRQVPGLPVDALIVTYVATRGRPPQAVRSLIDFLLKQGAERATLYALDHAEPLSHS